MHIKPPINKIFCRTSIAIFFCSTLIATDIMAPYPVQANPQQLMDEANALLQHKKMNRAIIKLNEALKEDPKYKPALELRALIEVSQNQTDAALKDYNVLLQLEPGNITALTNRASIYGLLGKTKEAFKDFDQAIRLDPKAASAYSNRCILDYSTGDFKKGIEDGTKAIEIDKSFAGAYLNRAYCLEETNKTDEAINDFSKVIGLAQGSRTLIFEACFDRGNLLMSKKKYDSAIEDYTIAMKMEPRFVGVYNNRAVAYQAVGKKDLADSDLTRVYKIMPAAAYLYRNQLLMELSSKQTAEVLQKLGTSTPFELVPKKRVAALFSRPVFEKAISTYTPILEKIPADLATQFKSATANFCLGNFAAAAQQYQRFLAMGAKDSNYFDSSLMYAYFALKLGSKDNEANKLLASYGNTRQPGTWLGKVLEFLNGKLKDKDLIAAAHSDREKANAHCLVGLNFLALHNKTGADAEFQWVVKNANQLSDDYWIAMSQISALHGQH